jgi:hypothetical protein
MPAIQSTVFASSRQIYLLTFMTKERAVCSLSVVLRPSARESSGQWLTVSEDDFILML